MQYKNKQLRHELKYFINKQQYWLLRNRLKETLSVDAHGDEQNTYMIRSLYFDDMYQSALVQKESGVNIRHKYRIRIYNYSDQVIRLERKNKINKYINKQDARLTKEVFYQILQGDIGGIRDSDHPVLRDFCMEYQNKLLRPRTIVDYDREAYISPLGNVRITFDKDLRGGVNDFDIFDPNLLTKNILTDDQLILEVKFDDYLPSHIYNLLQMPNLHQTAASKYVLCTKFLKNIKY